MYELIFTAVTVLGLLVIAFGIATLAWPVAAAGGFLVFAAEFASWAHAPKRKKVDAK